MAEKQNHLLELVMFDIAYVISNCDYEYSSDEKKYLNVILDRYSEDDKELLKLRTQFLDSILEVGINLRMVLIGDINSAHWACSFLLSRRLRSRSGTWLGRRR